MTPEEIRHRIWAIDLELVRLQSERVRLEKELMKQCPKHKWVFNVDYWYCSECQATR